MNRVALDWITMGLSYTEFKIKNTRVLVGSRPDCFGLGIDEFKSIDAWLSVSDRYVNYPNNVTHRWFPWEESLLPPYYVVIPCLITLQKWIQKDNLNKIYIHCCAGTHRAPEILGAYLKVFHTDEEAKKICEEATVSERRGEHYKAKPLYYIDYDLSKSDNLKKVLDYMKHKYDYNRSRDHTSIEMILKELDIKANDTPLSLS